GPGRGGARGVARDPRVPEIDGPTGLDQEVSSGLRLLERDLRERDEGELHVVEIDRPRRDRAERLGDLALAPLRPPGQQDRRSLDLVVPTRSLAHRCLLRARTTPAV